MSPQGSILRNINQSQDVMHNISIAESIELQGEQEVMDDYGVSQQHSKRESTSNVIKTPNLLVHDQTARVAPLINLKKVGPMVTSGRDFYH